MANGVCIDGGEMSHRRRWQNAFHTTPGDFPGCDGQNLLGQPWVPNAACLADEHRLVRMDEPSTDKFTTASRVKVLK